MCAACQTRMYMWGVIASVHMLLRWEHAVGRHRRDAVHRLTAGLVMTAWVEGARTSGLRVLSSSVAAEGPAVRMNF